MNFDTRVNIFIGDNGQGKTNLLEAISLLSGGIPFRAFDPEKLVRNNQEFAFLSAQFKVLGSIDQVKLKLAREGRAYLLNEKKTPRSQLWKRFGTVVFSPESLKLIKAGPAERRSQIDEIIISLNPDLWSFYAAYQKCLKQRNKLLKNMQDRPSKSDREILESLTETLLKSGAHIVHLRLEILRKIQPYLQRYLASILRQQNVDIAVDYVVSERSAIAWNENQVYDALRSRQRELASAEMKSGQTLIGPQKHDLRFLFQNEDARYFCSQGQQRSIVQALKTAQIELFREQRGNSPLLLLDDVLSELDELRRKTLIEVLGNVEAPIYMTTTDVDSWAGFENGRISTFKISNGVVKREGWI